MSLLVAAVLAIAASGSEASPAPTATPLKMIGHVHSSLLCTALRDSIFHSVEGLRINDQLIGQGQIMLAKMAFDSVAGPQRPVNAGAGGRAQGIPASNGLQMHNYQMGQLVHAIAQNLDRVNGLLNDPAHFPAKPASDDQSMLAAAKKSLQYVADQQRVTLNILSGAYETAALQLLLSKGDGTQGALGQTSVPDTTFNLENATMGSSAAQTNPTSTGATRSNTASSSNSATATGAPVESSLFANNSFGRLALGTLYQERITQRTEAGVTPAITPIVDACR